MLTGERFVIIRLYLFLIKILNYGSLLSERVESSLHDRYSSSSLV